MGALVQDCIQLQFTNTGLVLKPGLVCSKISMVCTCPCRQWTSQNSPSRSGHNTLALADYINKVPHA